jgi:hypothetical protein
MHEDEPIAELTTEQFAAAKARGLGRMRGPFIHLLRLDAELCAPAMPNSARG